MVENFPDLIEKKKYVDSRSSQKTKQENTKKATHKHIIVEQLKAKGKEKILKARIKQTKNTIHFI